jgi:glycerophosphoryl diester phosphodiesterase
MRSFICVHNNLRTLAFLLAIQMLTWMIAHRGESHDAPENTLASFALAWERNVPAIELDVHLTADGKLIVCHDPDTQRTAGQKLVIKETPLKVLKTLEVGSWKHPQYRGERMPTLDQVLQRMPNEKNAYVEIKVGPEALDELVEVLHRNPRPASEVNIISFNLETCRQAKRMLQDHKVYYLVSQKQSAESGNWLPTTEEMIAHAKDANLDGLDVHFDRPSVTAQIIRQVHEAGLELLVWTIDDPEIARKFIEAGVDGITSNQAHWLSQQLHR